MRALESLIKKHGGWNKASRYAIAPKTKNELEKIIKERIKIDGNECDLNDIDTSAITDMSLLFANMEYFNGDVSQWDVSHVKNMPQMFMGCKNFNCDLSEWDVSRVKNMYQMFDGCKKFNCDLSKWDVSSVSDFSVMFFNTSIDCDLSSWDTATGGARCYNMFTFDDDIKKYGYICKMKKKNMPEFYLLKYGDQHAK